MTITKTFPTIVFVLTQNILVFLAPAQAGDPETLLQQLGEHDQSRRMEAIRELGRLGPEATYTGATCKINTFTSL